MLLSLAFLLIIAGCGDESKTSDEKIECDQGAVIKIGLILAKRGPINGKKIQLIKYT